MKVDSQNRQLFQNLLSTTKYFFHMACCEFVKVNLTIISIQRFTHAFDSAFNCAFDKSNVCGSH